MATTATFNNMLKRYMPFELLVEELKRHNYFWNKVEKKQGWKGGTMEVPFEGAEASSLQFGSLTADNDIAEAVEVMGSIQSQPELWGTMIFNEKDLDRHSGDMEASYLEIGPGKVKGFTEFMAENISIALLNKGQKAVITADGTNGGLITVDKPQRFRIGEKLTFWKTGPTTVNGYVTAINMATKVLTIKDARTGGNAVDLSTYTLANAAKVFLPGAVSAGFTSLFDQLASATNGGASSLFGVTKTDYSFLQAQQIAGSSYDATTILEGLYDAMFDVKDLGKGKPTELVMSNKHFKNCVKQLETARNFTVSDKKAGYGFSSIDLLGNSGGMTITGIADMNDSEIYVMDWSALKFHGDKFFDRKRHLDGNEFYLQRTTSGYKYIVDVKFYGDLVVHNPSHCGIITGISY